jgi:hypothetical protein
MGARLRLAVDRAGVRHSPSLHPRSGTRTWRSDRHRAVQRPRAVSERRRCGSGVVLRALSRRGSQRRKGQFAVSRRRWPASVVITGSPFDDRAPPRPRDSSPCRLVRGAPRRYAGRSAGDRARGAGERGGHPRDLPAVSRPTGCLLRLYRSDPIGQPGAHGGSPGGVARGERRKSGAPGDAASGEHLLLDDRPAPRPGPGVRGADPRLQRFAAPLQGRGPRLGGRPRATGGRCHRQRAVSTNSPKGNARA